MSQLATLIGMFGAIAVLVALKKNSFWMLGFLFGSMVALPITLIAIRTLPKGREDWNDFWRFYELKYKVGVRFLFPLYGFLLGLGLVSLVALFA